MAISPELRRQLAVRNTIRKARDPNIEREPNGRKSRSKSADWVVYFIKAEGSGLVKIGYANNVESRLSSLAVGSPFELRVISEVRCIDRDDAKRVEKHFHVRFDSRGRRVRGEWFRITENEIEAAKEDFFDEIFGKVRTA